MPASPFSAHSVPLQVVREAAYVTTSKDVGKWQQVVLQNRRAEQLVFPLRQDIATVTPLERATSAWKVAQGGSHSWGGLWGSVGQVHVSWLCWGQWWRWGWHWAGAH